LKKFNQSGYTTAPGALTARINIPIIKTRSKKMNKIIGEIKNSVLVGDY